MTIEENQIKTLKCILEIRECFVLGSYKVILNNSKTIVEVGYMQVFSYVFLTPLEYFYILKKDFPRLNN